MSPEKIEGKNRQKTYIQKKRTGGKSGSKFALNTKIKNQHKSFDERKREKAFKFNLPTAAYDKKAEIWALGMLLLEMLRHTKPPFDEKDRIKQIMLTKEQVKAGELTKMIKSYSSKVRIVLTSLLHL